MPRDLFAQGNDLMAPPAAPTLPRPSVNPLVGTAASATQGLTLGFADEIGAALAAPIAMFQEGKIGIDELAKHYRGIRDMARSRQSTFAEEHPVIDTTAQIVGGLGSAAGALRSTARAVAPKLLQALPKAVGWGAAYGGTAGVGYSEADDLPGWAADAAKGAAVGALIGTVTPAITRAIAATINAPIRAVRLLKSNRANRAIVAALERDGLTVEQAAVKLSKMGPEATLADLNTPNIMALAEGVTSQSGKGSAMYKALSAGRQMRQSTRVEDALRVGLATPEKFLDALRTQQQTLRNIGAKAYKAAYQQPVVWNSATGKQLWKMLTKNPELMRAWQMGHDIARREGVNLGGIYRTKGGQVTDKLKQPTMRVLDYIKRGLDDMVPRDDYGRVIASNEARSYLALQRRYLELVDKMNPAYKAAREAYTDPKRIEQAMLWGRKFLREDSEVLREVYDGLESQAERHAYRIGAVKELSERLRKSSFTRDTYKQIFHSRDMRERLRVIFPDRKSYVAFARIMNSEAKMFDSQTEILRNSATARRTAAQADVNRPMPVVSQMTAAGDALLHPVQSMRAGVQAGGQLTAPTGTEAGRNALAEILFRKRPDIQQALGPAAPPNVAQLPAQTDVSLPLIARILYAQQQGQQQQPQGMPVR